MFSFWYFPRSDSRPSNLKVNANVDGEINLRIQNLDSLMKNIKSFYLVSHGLPYLGFFNCRIFQQHRTLQLLIIKTYT